MERAAKFLKQHAALIGILLLGAFLRIFDLGSLPNGFFADEASNGYDALGLAKTLRDRTGEFLPLFLRGPGDYREAIYSYVTAPFVLVFGLSEFTTRLPAALAGIATIGGVYWLARKMFGKNVAILAALFVAISPWHVMLSRIAFRVILEVLLVVLASAAFLRGQKHPGWLIASAILFALGAWTYFGARLFVPLYVAGLALVSLREMLAHKAYTAIAALTFGAIVLALVPFWLSPEGMARTGEVKFDLAPAALARNYFSYWSPDYLFITGDPQPRHGVRGVGMLHLFEIVTLMLGILYLLREHGPGKRAMLVWMALYPVPALLFDPMHGLRSAVGAPMFAILSGLGAVRLLERPGFDRRVLRTALAAAIVISFAVFGARYFYKYRDVTAPWQGGFKTVLAAAEARPDDRILMSEFYGARELTLFYLQTPPAEYQAHLATGPGAFETIGRYRFIPAARIFEHPPGTLAIVEKAELRDIGGDRAHVLAQAGEFRLIQLPEPGRP